MNLIQRSIDSLAIKLLNRYMELGACVVKALQEFVIIMNENDELKFKCMSV